MENKNTQPAPLSEDTKAIITVISLFSFYPIGVVLMWMWTKWQSWVKWTITLLGLVPFVLFGVFVAFAILAASMKDRTNPNDFNPIVPLPNPDQGLDDSYTPPEEDGTMCTMDALECPDGSFVGRSGPNCEFICPGDF